MRGLLKPERLGFLGAVLVLLAAIFFDDGTDGTIVPIPDDIRTRPAPSAPGDSSRGTGPGVDRDTSRRPGLQPETQRRRPLPSASPSDPVFRVDIGAKGNSTGTAFSIGDGWWMTARHVLDGCNRYGVVRNQRLWERGTDRFVHAGADIAVFRTDRQGPPLALDPRRLRYGETGYMIGYPQGKPAVVVGKVLGRSRMASRGRYAFEEPVVAWSEVTRQPEFQGSLGGISGGPALSGAGELIGVAVAASRRRGRVFTSAPVTLRGVWDHVPGTRDGTEAVHDPIEPSRLSETSRAFFDGMTIARVACQVND